jgi:hypothetical protein
VSVGVRVLTVLAFGACVVLAIRLLDRPNPVKQPKAGSNGMRVADAIARAQAQEVAVTGFAFEGGGWPLRLCDSRKSGSPPSCIGPFVYVAGIDRGSFNMKRGRTADRAVYWTADAVTLLGTLQGTELTVSQVLSASG